MQHIEGHTTNHSQHRIRLGTTFSVACTTAVVARGGDLADDELPDRSLAVAMADSSVRQAATRRTIPRDQIAERAESRVSPMPQGLVKTPDELRDILASLPGPEVNRRAPAAGWLATAA